MRIVNTSAGPRGLNTKDGLVILAPGEDFDGAMDAAEVSVAKATGWFEFPKAKADEEKGGK